MSQSALQELLEAEGVYLEEEEEEEEEERGGERNVHDVMDVS